MPVARRLLLALGFLLVVLLGGTAGYVVVADAPLLDALYLTVITVFGVGFAETIPLDQGGRILTMVVIVLGVGGFALVTVTSLEFLIEGHLREILGRRRMDRHLAGLAGHTIVCGFGRVGRQAAEDLDAEGTEVVVVDPDPARVEMARARGLPHIQGSGSAEAVLERAGIERARGLAACTDEDATNVLIALTAKALRSDVFVVCRIKDAENESKARQAGADRVIAPTQIGGRRIAALIARPYVVDFLDVVTHGTDVDLVLEELVLGLGSPLVGRTIADVQLRDRYGANIVAIKTVGEAVPTMKPLPDHRLEAGDVLVVIGSREDLDRLQAAGR